MCKTNIKNDKMILKSKTFTSVFQFSTDQAETEDTPAFKIMETFAENESKLELQESDISATY